jgi:hypothetical protein
MLWINREERGGEERGEGKKEREREREQLMVTSRLFIL